MKRRDNGRIVCANHASGAQWSSAATPGDLGPTCYKDEDTDDEKQAQAKAKAKAKAKTNMHMRIT